MLNNVYNFQDDEKNTAIRLGAPPAYALHSIHQVARQYTEGVTI